MGKVFIIHAVVIYQLIFTEPEQQKGRSRSAPTRHVETTYVGTIPHESES